MGLLFSSARMSKNVVDGTKSKATVFCRIEGAAEKMNGRRCKLHEEMRNRTSRMMEVNDKVRFLTDGAPGGLVQG